MLPCNMCGLAGQPFLTLDAVPPIGNCFCPTDEQARQFPLIDVSYLWCRECQHISIAKERFVGFDPQYNNDQTASGVARAHYRNVTTEIENCVPHHGAKIVEIGCGRGELLSMLEQRGYWNLQGYDPAAPDGTSQYIHREYWQHLGAPDIDLIVLRHTLEEMQDVGAFLSEVGASLTDSGLVYCEITNASRLMRMQDIFSLYPEYSNIFSVSSLSSLFGRHGISVERVVGHNDDEWLGLWGRKVGTAHNFFDGQKLLNDVIRRIGDLPHPVVLWGAGGRGGNILSFCRTNPSLVPFVVDLNKTKQARFIPPFGQEVVGPDYLSIVAPQTIVVSSAKYKDEVVAIAPAGCLVLSINELMPSLEQ